MSVKGQEPHPMRVWSKLSDEDREAYREMCRDIDGEVTSKRLIELIRTCEPEFDLAS